jgi:acid phosphatase family membrane protein YuiD
MAYNPYIIVPLATWAVAQVAKFAIAGIKGEIDFKNLYASGGMPSVHSAVVTSLAVTAYLVDGASSPVFGIAAVFAAIVIYDSLGVRRAVGNQAIAMNRLLDGLDTAKVRFNYSELRVTEVKGHSPAEVIAGAIVGAALGGLFNYDHITPFITYLQAVATHKELVFYMVLFGLIVLGGALQNAILRSKFAKSRAIRELSRNILLLTQLIGWLGLLAVVFIYERASYLAWRLWPLLLIVIGISWAVTIYVKSNKTLSASLRKEADEARKRKWFTFGRNKKKS